MTASGQAPVTNGVLGEGVEPNLRRRTQAAGWLLFTSTAAIALAEVVVRPGENLAVSATHLMALGLLGLLLILSYRVTISWGLVLLALSALALTAAEASLVWILTGDATTASFVFVALAMGSAALLPWGTAPQVTLTAFLAILFPVTILLTEGFVSPTRWREFAGLVVVLGASAYIALELHRSRDRARIEGERRRNREQELERERYFLRQIIDTNPHLVFAKDKDGRFTLVNEAVARIYGTTVGELIGRTDADFNPHPEEVEFFRSVDRLVFETGREHVIEEEKITDAITGEERWLQTIKRPLFGSDGSVVQVLGVATDITTRRRFERELTEEAHVAATLSVAAEEIIAALSKPQILLGRLCEIATASLGGRWAQLWLVDSDREEAYPITAHNAPPETWTALRVVRLPLRFVQPLWDEVQQRKVVPLNRESAAQVVPAFLLQLAVDCTGALIVPLRRGDSIAGALIVGLLEEPLSLNRNQERIAGGLAQLASLALEDARVVEKLEQASKLKSEFLATMSHELRTPLNVIIGYASLLREQVIGTLNAEQTHALDRLHANAFQLLDMINATLDLTRLESGHLPVEIRQVNLSEVVAGAVKEVRQQVHRHDIDLWCLVPSTGPLIETDPVKLKIIVKNLVSNALKFTGWGWVRVSTLVNGEAIQIQVSDTGLGIPRDEQPIIFEPFRQGGHTVGQFQGVGLGLYIVRRLVDALGGAVMVDSEPGRGSTFIVELPRTNPGSRKARRMSRSS